MVPLPRHGQTARTGGCGTTAPAAGAVAASVSPTASSQSLSSASPAWSSYGWWWQARVSADQAWLGSAGDAESSEVLRQADELGLRGRSASVRPLLRQ